MDTNSDNRPSHHHHHKRRRPTRWWWLVAVAALTLLAGACSGSDGDETSSDAGGTEDSETEASDESDDAMEEFDEGDDEAMEDEGASVQPSTTIAAIQGDTDSDDDAATDESAEPSAEDGASPDGPLGTGGASVTPTAADLGRKLIFTAFLNVGVDDVPAASTEATSIIEGLGGFLFGQSTEGGAQPRSELIFKVLPNDFNLALERLGTVGELRNQTVTTDDVTERVVDLQSRIEVAELGVARLRTALEETIGLEDYAEVERLLLDRESELEVMRGQLRTLQDRVDLATITLVLTQDRVENQIEVRITSYPGFDEGRACPGSGDLRVEENSEVTICFELTNLGDQTLTDVVLTDSVLEIGSDTELIPVFGELTELAPGQSVLVAYETEVERTLRLRTRVVAIPTDGSSTEPAGPSVTGQDEAEIRTFPSEDGPGFGDGFGAALGVLRGLWTVVTVTIGFLLPLLILTPLVVLGWRAFGALRRRRPSRASGPSAPPGPPGHGGPAGPGGPGSVPGPVVPPPPAPPAGVTSSEES